jgi:hypothetical protein
MMACGIAGRIAFRFHDPPAKPPLGQIVNDDLADQEASEV